MMQVTHTVRCCLITFCLLICFNLVFSQNQSGTNFNADNAPKDLSLSTTGLLKEETVRRIFQGDFLNIPFGRDNMNFAILFNAYLTSYASRCDGSLPPDKIELKRRECAKESVTKNGYGVEISRTCVEWVMVSTGLYASREMYDAKW